MRDRVSCAKVELLHHNSLKGDHIPHEKEYNTRHGISAIPNEVRREIRRQPRQSEVQQEPVVHLLLEAALGRKCGVPGLPVQTPPQPSQPAHGGRAEAHPRHAPQEPDPRHDRTLAPPAAARLYTLSGESVPCHAQNGSLPRRKAQKDIQAQAV